MSELFTIKTVVRNSPETQQLQDIIKNEWGNNEHTGISDENLHSILVVTDQNGKVLGGAIIHVVPWHHFKWFFISFLIVEKNSRDLGIGTWLLNKCKQITEDEKITEFEKRIELALYAEEHNLRSRKFYESRGFIMSHEEEGVYDEGDGIACVYVWTPEKYKFISDD